LAAVVGDMLAAEVIPVGTLGVKDNPVVKDTLEVTVEEQIPVTRFRLASSALIKYPKEVVFRVPK
jgi:hypothetical protein